MRLRASRSVRGCVSACDSQNAGWSTERIVRYLTVLIGRDPGLSGWSRPGLLFVSVGVAAVPTIEGSRCCLAGAASPDGRVFSSNANGLFGLDEASNALLWRYSGAFAPVVADGLVFAQPGGEVVAIGSPAAAPVPEPSTLLLGSGLAGLGGVAWRRHRRRWSSHNITEGTAPSGIAFPKYPSPSREAVWQTRAGR